LVERPSNAIDLGQHWRDRDRAQPRLLDLADIEPADDPARPCDSALDLLDGRSAIPPSIAVTVPPGDDALASEGPAVAKLETIDVGVP
jgi:hypothetical protein